MADMRSKISGISKGKRIRAVVVEIFNGFATVSASGRLYKGLNVIGGPAVVGQNVFIDFSSGTPIVHAYSSASSFSTTITPKSVTVRVVKDTQLADPITGLVPEAHTHTESQIIDLDHDAQKIQGTPVDAATALDDKKFLQYDQENEKYILATSSNGDVVGPASVTDGHLALFDGTTGKIIKDGGAPVGGGDVHGATSVVDGHLAVFDTDGYHIKDGGIPLVNIRQFIFTIEGTLIVTTNPLRIYNCTGATLTISKIFLAINTVPTGAAVIVDIHKNGTTIFTTQTNRPQIAISANTGQSTSIDVAPWADGDYLQMAVDQIGSAIAGSNLSVYVVAR